MKSLVGSYVLRLPRFNESRSKIDGFEPLNEIDPLGVGLENILRRVYPYFYFEIVYRDYRNA